MPSNGPRRSASGSRFLGTKCQRQVAISRVIAAATVAVVLVSLAVPGAEAQPSSGDRLAYVLTGADLLQGADVIEVAFGESVPSDLFSQPDAEQVTDRDLLGHWLVQSMPYATEGSPNPTPADLSIVALTVHHDGHIVRLYLPAASAARLNPAANLVRITYLRANHPSVVIGEPRRTGARARWIGAATADAADIYFSGKITSADGADTTYGAELKVRHRWSLRRFGELGGRFDFAGEALENGDPDTIVLGADYQLIEPLGPEAGVIVRAVPIGAELDREGSTRNLVTAIEGKWILPGVHPWKRSPANLSVLTGIEGGTNYRNPLQPDGGGGYLRWKVGVAGAFHTPIGGAFGLTLSALWQRRFLTSDEIFVHMVAGEQRAALTDESRNHLAIDLTFDITESFGLAVQYRDGSLPPRFEEVRSSIATSLVLKLQRIAR